MPRSLVPNFVFSNGRCLPRQCGKLRSSEVTCTAETPLSAPDIQYTNSKQDTLIAHSPSGSTRRYSTGNLTEAIRAYTVDCSSKALRIAETHFERYTGGDYASTASRMTMQQRLERSPALVLNSDYQPLSYTPLSVWSWQEAVKAVFMGRVVVVAEYSECVIRSANLVMRVPSVIALRTYQKRNTAKHPHFIRRNVYIRDMFTCQYCRRQCKPASLTYDHVVPRSKGGETSWNNVVTACTSCNNKKGDLSLDAFARKYKVQLKKSPHAPSHAELTNKARRLPLYRNHHETWDAYVG